MIDSKKIKPLNGWVLVMPDAHKETAQIDGRETGLFVSNIEHHADSRGKVTAYNRKEKHLSTTGTVLSVPDNCNFLGHKMKKIMRKYLGENGLINEISVAKEIADMRKSTTSYEVPVEVNPGDKVMFSYNVHLDENKYIETESGRAFFLKYDRLKCVLNEDGSVKSMLNGYVSAKKVFFDSNEIGGIFTSLEKEEQINKSKRLMAVEVVSSGCKVSGYLDFPDDFDEDMEVSKGDVIIVDTRTKVNLENSIHQTQKDPLYVFHRRSIRMYKEDFDQIGLTHKNVVIDDLLSKRL